MSIPGGAPGDRHPAIDRFATLFTVAPIGIALTDNDGTIVEANPALGTILGRDCDTLRGTQLADLASTPADAESLRSVVSSRPAVAGEARRVRVVLEHAEDGPVRTRLTLTHVSADDSERAYPVVMVEDVNDLHLLHETLRHQNVHDQLTGLPNAAMFHGQVEAAMVDRQYRMISLVFLDIDGFRVINDGLGAEVGDEVLRRVATTLQSVFSSHDAVIARRTGDGFGILLRGELIPQNVIELVEEAFERLSEPMYVEGHGIGVHASAGIVVREVGDGTAAQLGQAAEITLHRAKEAGRAKWMLYEPELDAQDRDRYRKGAIMAGALENGEFELVYQPTVKLDGSGNVPVVNAIPRWNQPGSGEVTSEEFIPIADTTGMTLRLGRWLLNDAIATSARWRTATDGRQPDICLRLPARLAIDDDLVRMVRQELTRHELPADKLRLCADGTTVVDTRGVVLDSLAVLGEIGVKLVLAISGPADLQLIRRHELPVGYVVLTKELVDGLLDPSTEAAAAIHLEHLVKAASELGLRIGAEGVETAEQARRLADLGVIAARGDFYREELSADDIEKLITEGLRPREQPAGD